VYIGTPEECSAAKDRDDHDDDEGLHVEAGQQPMKVPAILPVETTHPNLPQE
jgi:hypothetical protein